MTSRSIYVAANGIFSFFLMARKYSIVYMYRVFSIHSSVSGHFGCCPVVATVNSAAINIWGARIFSHCNFVWIYAQE